MARPFAPGLYVRVHFIRRVSSDHVLYRLVTARVEFHPWVDLQNSAIVDEYSAALCNEILDVVSCEYTIFARCRFRRHGHHIHGYVETVESMSSAWLTQ